MKRILLNVCAIFLLSGCSVTPEYTRPNVDTPQNWSAGTSSGDIQIAADWWKNFDSEELNTLMSQALIENNDLRAALARIEQAQANLKIVGASLLPTLDASGGAAHTHTNPASGNSSTVNALNAGVDISYEIDLFGANRAAVDSASAAYQSSRFDHDALALVVMGEVANGYFTTLNLQERLKIAQSNLGNARDVQNVIQAKFDAGAISALDLAQQRAVVANNESVLAALVQQQTIAKNALAILLGKSPQDMAINAATLDALSVPVIAPGQPSSLLTRRPDISSAESALIAANADIGAARAALFPSVTLGLGWNAAMSGFGNPATTTLALLSSLSAPIFQGGRLEGGVEKTTARQSELVENYRKTVLTSFKEVEDALAGVKAAQLRQTSLQTAKKESQRAYDISKTQYKAGAIDFQTLLSSQQSLFNAADSYAQARLSMLVSSVELYKALGGGWVQEIP